MPLVEVLFSTQKHKLCQTLTKNTIWVSKFGYKFGQISNKLLKKNVVIPDIHAIGGGEPYQTPRGEKY